MTPNARPLFLAMIGAALLGAAVGIGEAVGIAWLGRLWLSAPLLLLTMGAVGGALAVLPSVLIAPERSLRGGLAAAGLTLLSLEGVLAILTDPPPFQEPPWYSGSVLAGVGLVVVLGGAWVLLRRAPALSWAACSLPIFFALLHRQPVTEHQGGGGANLLIVTLDTTRADHMGAYGYERETSPVFDALAAQGVLFQAAIAPIAVTGPSHTSLLTGSGTWSHGTLLNGIPMPQDRPTIAQVLGEQGYQTGAFVSAYVLDGKYGFAQGFTTYDDDFSGLQGWDRTLLGRIQSAARRRLNPHQVVERGSEQTVDQALDWLEGRQGPWMLWVHLFDAHGPYEPPPPYDTRWYDGDPRDPSHDSMEQVHDVAPYLVESLKGVRDVDWVIAQYDGEIAHADAQMGRLIDAVDALSTETLVLVSADHGESLGEQDVWFNHGDDLFDASTHIPAAMRFPGVIPAGTQVSGMVEISDFAPTLYTLLGVEIPTEVQGMSLAPDWTGRSVARGLAYDREANLHARELDPTHKPTLRLVGLRSPGSLYVRRESPDFVDALYLSTAQDCALCTLLDHNQAPEFPLEVSALQDQAQNLLSGDADRSAADLSDSERAMLEALGYME